MTTPADPVLVANPELLTALCLADGAAVTAALASARLLVPADALSDASSALATGTGPAGERLVWAFTDAEALWAWDRHPRPAAAVLSPTEIARCVAPEVGRSPAMLVVNAAGPAATLIATAPVPSGAGGDRVPGPPPDQLGPPLDVEVGAPDARAVLRRQARMALDTARAEAAAGAHGRAVEAFTHGAQACGRLGDRLHGAALMAESAHHRWATGDRNMAQEVAERAAAVLASIGELDLAAEALLDAADRALAGNDHAEANRLATTSQELVAGSPIGRRLGATWYRLGAATAREETRGGG